jgi:hypothetical protein
MQDQVAILAFHHLQVSPPLSKGLIVVRVDAREITISTCGEFSVSELQQLKTLADMTSLLQIFTNSFSTCNYMIWAWSS